MVQILRHISQGKPPQQVQKIVTMLLLLLLLPWLPSPPAFTAVIPPPPPPLPLLPPPELIITFSATGRALQRDKIDHRKTPLANPYPPLTHAPPKPEGKVSHPQRRRSVQVDTPDVGPCWTLDVSGTKGKRSDSTQMLSWIRNPEERGLRCAAHICLRGRTCVPTCAARSTLGYGPPAAAPGVCARVSGGCTLWGSSPARGRPGSAVHGSGHVCPGAALGPALQPVVLPPISPPSLLHNIRLYCLVEAPQWKYHKTPPYMSNNPVKDSRWYLTQLRHRENDTKCFVSNCITASLSKSLFGRFYRATKYIWLVPLPDEVPAAWGWKKVIIDHVLFMSSLLCKLNLLCHISSKIWIF